MVTPPQRLEAFISYSRRDLAFASELRQELEKCGRAAWIDLEGIPPTAEWWEEIRQAIRNAEHFLFIVSPDAVASPTCQRELEYAVECGKRVIPLLAKPTPIGIPLAIAKLQWIDVSGSRTIDEYCAALIEAFDTDLDWVRWHTRTLTRANDWSQHRQDRSLLLRGLELSEAVSLLAHPEKQQSSLTDLHRGFVEASVRDDRLRRRNRVLVVSVTLFLLASFGLYGAWQMQRRNRERSSEELATRSKSALTDNAVASLMLSLDALEQAHTPAAYQALSSALSVNRVRGTLLGRGRETVSAAYLRDGTAVATLAEDGTLGVWATESNILLHRIASKITAPTRVSFSQSGDRIFATGDEAICAWRTSDFVELGCWGRDTLLGANHTADGESVFLSGAGLEIVDIKTQVRHKFPGLETTLCGAVRISTDGRVMAIAILPDRSSGGTVLLLRDEGGSLKAARTQSTRGLARLVLSPDGNRVVTVDDDSAVAMSDTGSGKLLYMPANRRPVMSAGFSPGGRWMMTWHEDHSVTVVDSASGAILGDFQLNNSRLGTPTVVAVLNEAPWILAGGSSGQAAVYDIRGQEVFALSGGSKLINGFALAPDGRTGLSFGEEDLLWDLTLAGALSAIKAHTGPVETVKFADEDRRVITGGADGQVREWDLVRPGEARLLAEHADWVQSSLPLPGASKILTAGLDGVVRIVDPDRPQENWSARVYQSNPKDDRAGWIWSVAITQDGQRAATVGQDGALVLLALRPPGVIRRRPGDGTPLTSVAYEANGRFVAVGDETGRIFALNAEDGREHNLKAHDGPVMKLAISPDSRTLLSVSADATVRMYDTTSWKPLFELAASKQPLTTGGFSPDGRLFLAAGSDTAVYVGNAASGQLVAALDGHLDTVTSALFLSADRVVTGSADGRVRVWDTEGGQLLSMIDLQSEVRALDATRRGDLIGIALSDGRLVLWPCPLWGELEQAVATGYKRVAPVVAGIREAVADRTDPSR